eukprot:TRINITY_DN23774_c0_g1_i1.p1 TRINITY_DN23774_c0_g1~~TRINITY_DN23774_c0_g1_i1.p1  ORF type:complete len:118 (+),score=15.49 TRINITY_DN23774_c0_g1_i1:153-506(+)
MRRSNTVGFESPNFGGGLLEGLSEDYTEEDDYSDVYARSPHTMNSNHANRHPYSHNNSQQDTVHHHHNRNISRHNNTNNNESLISQSLSSSLRHAHNAPLKGFRELSMLDKNFSSYK